MKDNFSKQADIYAKYRPTYPQGLFDFILQHTDKKQNAWDCATGNGQSAKVLARHFKKIFATDISQKQIDNAEQAANIFYSVQSAEQTDFADNIFDLITVSQALHWFRFDKFYAEVTRTGLQHSWLAVWMYSLLRVSKEIDAIIETYHFKTLDKYWDNERKYVDNNYSTIPFPFKEIKTPVFSIEYYWSLDELEGYFNTWSALQKFITVNNYNPVPDVVKQIKEYWKNERMKIVFPLYLRMGQIEK
jgi:ubiquinone/menaquinone biosynthesis C-methylase UbiE